MGLITLAITLKLIEDIERQSRGLKPRKSRQIIKPIMINELKL